MTAIQIAELKLGPGVLGFCPMPGSVGSYGDDLKTLGKWKPDVVLSMTSRDELMCLGAGRLGDDLQAGGIVWWHFPVADYGTPDPGIAAFWPAIAEQAHRVLAGGGRVLAHCRGGCGRSGMVIMRLMVESGEAPAAALARLREARACAVETDEQRAWAAEPFCAG